MAWIAWTIVVLAVVALGACWVAGSGVWGRWDEYSAGDARPVTPTFGARNAIVLLSAGLDRWNPDAPFGPTTDGMARIQKAAADYKACKAANRTCEIIISGGDPSGHGVTDADLYAAEIAALGVSEADLILETRSRTTYENAKFVEPLLRRGHYDVTVLVTSTYHMRRAELAFDRLGFDVVPDAALADGPVFSLRPRRQNLWLAWRALHELGGIVQLHMYDWAGIH